MKIQHTEGPWKFINWSGLTEIRQANNETTGIALLGLSDDGALPTEQTIANARLIAAAPELLGALKSFLRCPSVGSDGPGNITLRVTNFNVDAARKAIAKVEGTER